MGAGGSELASNQEFRMEVLFFDPVSETPKHIGGEVYAEFVSAVNDLVTPGEWIPGPEDAYSRVREGVILLHGPLAQPADMNTAVNRVLRGVRVKASGGATGFAARVMRNVGPINSDTKECVGEETGPNDSFM